MKTQHVNMWCAILCTVVSEVILATRWLLCSALLTLPALSSHSVV